MAKVIIHNQAIIDGLTKRDDSIEYGGRLHHKATVLDNTYTDEELKAVSKFFNDWLKDVYIYGSDAIDVIGGIVSKGDESGSCKLVRSVKEATDEELHEILKGD